MKCSFIWCWNLDTSEHQKYLESSEMWCSRTMEKISWADPVRNEEMLHRVKKRNIIQIIIRRNAKWIGHILCRNFLLKHFVEGRMEGRIEVTRWRGRKRKPLLNNLKQKRGYWKLKGEALYRALWRTVCGRVNWPLVRQTTKWCKDRHNCKCWISP